MKIQKLRPKAKCPQKKRRRTTRFQPIPRPCRKRQVKMFQFSTGCYCYIVAFHMATLRLYPSVPVPISLQRHNYVSTKLSCNKIHTSKQQASSWRYKLFDTLFLLAFIILRSPNNKLPLSVHAIRTQLPMQL